MKTKRYLCRILTLEQDPAQNGQNHKYSNITYSDEKQFTIGSGSDADIRISGAGVEALHAQITIDVPHLYIKNLSKGETLINTYKITADNMEPFKSGEAIRFGKSNQVLFIELFRKFVEPHEESEAIVREAYEKSKSIASSVADQKRDLISLNKHAKELKEQTEIEIAERIEAARKKAAEIHQAALKAKEAIAQVTEQEVALAALKAEKEVERTLNEIKQSSEEKTQALMDQARLKAKEIKQEAEKETEGIIASGHRQAEFLIENAKKQAQAVAEESQRQIQAMASEIEKIKTETLENQTKRTAAIEDLASIKIDLKKAEDSKQQVHKEFQLEKERLQLFSDDLKRKIEGEQSKKREIEGEIEAFKLHSNKITAELAEAKISAQSEMERCRLDADKAISIKERLQKETGPLELNIEELKKNIKNLHNEHTKFLQRITEFKLQESKERDKMRIKLKKEYEVRVEFEKQWHSKQRLIEQHQLTKERAAKAKLEGLRLNEQAQKIAEKIHPLIGLELSSQFGDEQLANFTPKLENIISPIVQRCVMEEYEFRRENWERIRPFSFARELAQRAQVIRRQVGVTTLSLVFLLVALLVVWAHSSGFQIANMSNQSSKSPNSLTK